VKIKVLHILNSLQVGGLENGVVNLINNLDAQMFMHSICCIDSIGPMAERIKHPVSIFSLEKGESRNYLISLKIARLINRVKPDIIHTRNWSAIDGIIGARLAGVRIVIHGEHGREAGDPDGRNIKRKKIRKALSPWVSRFITVSNELQDWLIHDVGITPAKVTQIINGVDTDYIKPAGNKEQLKSELGLSPDTFVIGSVGRLDPVKDHETLLRAFKIASERKRDKEPVLIIVGSGPLKEDLKLIAGKLGISNSVNFAGERNDVIRLYSCMDVYVLPSIAEGISNTILEAMASGLPVLSSSVGGNLELVDQGQTGYFFSPGNVEELAVSICRYADNDSLAREHGFNGRQRAVDKFSIQQMTDKYRALYESFFQGEFPITAFSQKLL
jgi:sugar transferase (PEP-CTERM/EpsH1 system associated)